MQNRLSYAIGLTIASSAAWAQQGDGTDVGVSAHVLKPRLVDATRERIAVLGAA